MLGDVVKGILREAAEVALETLWPTRCAVCDLPGEEVLCDACEKALVAVDACQACPRCGAPFGLLQCTECNEVMLASANMAEFPAERMSHALVLDDAARRIVATYKDADERRLCALIAERMARCISPDEVRDGFAITYVPDSVEAYRRRGFDHSREIAENVARARGLPCEQLFERPRSADQRELGRRERIENMRGRLRMKEGTIVPPNVLVVDDVCTTGATIYAACLALRDAGAKRVHALTFAQVLD